MKRNEEELKNVSGGFKPSDVVGIACGNCKYAYNTLNAKDNRDVEDGCGYIREYQCPNCGAWNRI